MAGDFLVVGIGASAGGLEACTKFVEALPDSSGVAFILVQHLDPTHDSMMVDLLKSRTSLAVQEAADQMPIAVNHLYIIPPGAYLAVHKGLLQLSKPLERHGARLPVDFLLHSIADEYGARAVCVLLSGTGSDGSIGLKAVKDRGGLVIVQDPAEAAYDGMPRSAITTSAVDHVLPVAEIPAALVEYAKQVDSGTRVDGGRRQEDRIPELNQRDRLSDIIALLKAKTAHDFTLYKLGTLQRRIERRMALAAIAPNAMQDYFDLLVTDAAELDLLAQDLLINVTSFFRDRKVFEVLAEKVIPDLISSHASNQPIRIWIAGCSTGEEAYSVAMVFSESIAALKSGTKLQIFASDADPEAVAAAREGLYPEAIAADVSPARLSRFFTKDDRGYRIASELRETVVFTVQDVLADPPFSRLDLVSCRNLLIYLQPEAQARALSLFHFALCDGGILLLGSSETIGSAEGRFKVISKQDRLYRRIGRSRPTDWGFATGDGTGVRILRTPDERLRSRQAGLAELCRRLVLENYAPAAVLINQKYEVLYSLGPTQKYLRVALGHPSHDLLGMVGLGLRTKLRSAIQQASERKTIVIDSWSVGQERNQAAFSIAIEPITSEDEDLFLICFVDDQNVAAKAEPKRRRASNRGETAEVTELRRELDATRLELKGAIRNLELSSEEQKAINEEALSVNEEFQSTNEELLTSKEELQSLNEELTALNSQLQETLERQRTTSDDLQNVLYSTDVATLFLDHDLNIRFFTPATKTLFHVIASDVGRPLSDLNSLSPDGTILEDAKIVLKSLTAVEREIEGAKGAWFLRRVLPYHAHDGTVEGVVVTFTDVTERKRIASALEAAKQQAEVANIAKSRFLAAASHDLRQPLQTLALLQGLLAKLVDGEKAQKLIALMDPTLSAMSGMLNTLLDINQIDTGMVKPEIVRFPVNQLLAQLRNEFTYTAKANALELDVVPSSVSIETDPQLLSQILRNLLSNALKYTAVGKVLLGCRRQEGSVSIEIWDTGLGIPADQLDAIFDEYHQVDSRPHARSRGLGLGLSIVRHLANLLGHRVTVRSRVGKGSVFAIEVALAPQEGTQAAEPDSRPSSPLPPKTLRRRGRILIVEDDQALRNLLEIALTNDGHQVETAPDAAAALERVLRDKARPDLVLSGYALPSGMSGLQLTAKLRENFRTEIPAIVLTGDLSAETSADILSGNCTPLNKPVKLTELLDVIQRLLPVPLSSPVTRLPAAAPSASTASIIYVVDDDSQVREAISRIFQDEKRAVETFSTAEAFLAAFRHDADACVLIDNHLPGMSGLELLQKLREGHHRIPAIMITGDSDVQIVVQAMKAGAADFIEKPISRSALLHCVDHAFDQSRDSSALTAWQQTAAAQVAGLTPRQRQIMGLVLAGHTSKNIAADLGISQRTVENHRALIMEKTKTKSLPALARLALAAAPKEPNE